MKNHRYFIITGLIIIIGVFALTLASARPLLGAGAPTVVSYQGEINDSGTPYDGTGYFKFAVVNAAGDTSYWSNDTTSTRGDDPTAGVSVTGDEGLFQVRVGDTGLTNMTSLPPSAFSGTERYLRVWFSDDDATYTQLSPDHQFAAVPYALQAQEAADADTVDGLHAADLETHYDNVVIVAKSGGDYTTVQGAIDSITDASASNPYLVWVAPGVYNESVAMKSHVHLQGAGQEATIITSTITNSSLPLTQSTVILASDSSLRDLTVENDGAGNYSVALLASGGVSHSLVVDVTARTYGAGTENYGITLTGSGTWVELRFVAAHAENASNNNYGLYNEDGASATLQGGFCIGRTGIDGYGIYSTGSGTTLEAYGVTAMGEEASALNFGLMNSSGASAVLHGGFYEGRDGWDPGHTGGIGNTSADSTIEIVDVTAVGKFHSHNNYGLRNYEGAEARISGGSFTAEGGEYANGIENRHSGTSLIAEGVFSMADGGNGNVGLHNKDGAKAILSGSSFTAHGGIDANGIYNGGSGSELEAESVSALGMNGSSANFGIHNGSGGLVNLRAGSFSGEGGSSAYGIYNSSSGTHLTAESVTVMGRYSTSFNYGLCNVDSASAILSGGTFTGSSGNYAYGLYNEANSPTLIVTGAKAVGELGATYSYGLSQSDGTVKLGVTQLVGGANWVGGSRTCFQVYDGSYTGITCP